MNPHPLFCPNPDCPSRGVQNAGNIRVHCSLRQRWRCRTCKKTFSERQGTPFFGLKTDPVTVVLILTLLTHGCPLQAIVAACGFDERTVASWQDKAGKHCEQVHATLVTATPMDLQYVQADEVRVRLQRRLVVWMAMAICVPTRLWLGGVVSTHRDTALLRSLARLVHACAQCRPLLLVTDGGRGYVDAWHKAFRTPQFTGKPGRSRLLAWSEVAIAQTVKAYERGRCGGIGVCHLFGNKALIARLLPNAQVLNTAYIERLNATFRQRLCCLIRKGRALARLPESITPRMYLVGCLYNWCTPHQSLSQQTPCTPAMAAGLTHHIWSVGELLCYRVAPSPFVPPKRRGRKPKEAQPLVTA
jgi:transposase-like protein